MGTGVPSTRPMRRGSPLTAVMVVCFRSMSSRTSEGMGTFNCWRCWRMRLCFDVEKRLGSGVDATHATPASLGWPRRRMETASRVSKSTPCVRCVQPWARRRVSPCARRRLPISCEAAHPTKSGGGATASRVSKSMPPRWCIESTVLRSSVVHLWWLPTAFCQGEASAAAGRSPMRPESKARIATPPREPVRRGGAPRGRVAVGP